METGGGSDEAGSYEMLKFDSARKYVLLAERKTKKYRMFLCCALRFDEF